MSKLKDLAANNRESKSNLSGPQARRRRLAKPRRIAEAIIKENPFLGEHPESRRRRPKPSAKANQDLLLRTSW
jgi:hypothetical protein